MSASLVRTVRRSVLVRLLGICGLVLAVERSARADDPAIAVEARVEPSAIALGQAGKLALDIRVPEGFHLWSLAPGAGPLALTVALPKDGPLGAEGPWYGTEPVVRLDRGFGRELALYEGAVHLERRVRLARLPKDGEATTVVVRGQICTAENCVTQKVEVKLDFEGLRVVEAQDEPVFAGAPLPDKGPASSKGSTADASKDGVASAISAGAGEGGLEAAKAEGVLKFLLLAFLFGLGALATPCVFPAIPLTVSFFSKYSKESFGRGARLAAVYAATMVGTFTIAGVLISIFFGVTGIQRFAAHPIFNVVLASTLVFFALNLLGWFEIRVPSFVLGFVNSLEGKYGRSAMAASSEVKKSGAADYVVVAVAAVTATTVFFTCTVAFVGLVLVAAAKGEWFWPTLGMLAFSSAFALPFFLLAMFPQAAHRLRGRSGSWLGATRVTLGFLELAAAMKFLSNADLVWALHVVTRDLVLALWIPLFGIAGLYLLGKIHLGEEPAPAPDEHPSVLRVLASTVMFAISIYLAAGLFNGRAFGGWVDGWLPPLDYPGQAAGKASSQLTWLHDLEEARAKARAEHKLVFANYTGLTCTNCRYMEGAVFPRPEIAELLQTMVLVELYTDGGTAEQDRNREDQVARFRTAALPLYSVERADGSVIDTFASSTNDPAEFRRFLERALARSAPVVAEAPKDAPPTEKAPSNEEPAPSEGAAPEAARPLEIAKGSKDGASDSAEGSPVRVKVESGLVLRTVRLFDGAPEPAIVPGRWTLINFWASYCGPCMEELKTFLAAEGRQLEARGGRFVAVAIEDDEGLPKAREFAKSIGLGGASALRLPGDVTDKDVDPRLGFSGTGLPYTVLVAPSGEVVWKHEAKLEQTMLKAKLACFTGDGGSAKGAWVPKKCGGRRR